MRKNRRLGGQSLVEVLVSLGVVVVLAVSLVTTSLITQKASRAARNSTQATKLVQQNIEQVRVLRDRAGFDALASANCSVLNTTNLDPLQWQLVSCPTADGEQIVLGNVTFSRKLVISSPTSSQKQVVVTVSWSDSSGKQTVSNQTFLSLWCGTDLLNPPTPCP